MFVSFIPNSINFIALVGNALICVKTNLGKFVRDPWQRRDSGHDKGKMGGEIVAKHRAAWDEMRKQI